MPHQYAIRYWGQGTCDVCDWHEEGTRLWFVTGPERRAAFMCAGCIRTRLGDDVWADVQKKRTSPKVLASG